MSYLAHVGVKRRSGRYPWGSGEIPYQHEPWFQFLNERNKIKAKYPNITEVELARKLGFDSTADLRAHVEFSKAEKYSWDCTQVRMMIKDGLTNKSEIARRLGISEGTVRNILKHDNEVKVNNIKTVMNSLADNVDRKAIIDIGLGIEQQLGVSDTRLKNAVIELCKTGKYATQEIKTEQLGTGHLTNMKVLYPNKEPYTDKGYIYKHRDEIRMIDDCNISADGKRLQKVPPIVQVEASRVQIRYKDDPKQSGALKDGIIELRRGCPDLDLGFARYAQVRIAVEGGRYLKGIAMYSDDMPKGCDILVNSNKTKEQGWLKATKEQATDVPENPFGAAISPKFIVDKNGKVIGRSALNVVNEEGEWGKWNSTIAAQFLSKQDEKLVDRQLNLTVEKKQKEFDEIRSLTSPELKTKLLREFADECDSAAVKLKAEGLPRQSWNVILPFPKMKENEIYAPHYENGTKLALVRYPHSGTFEIPTVIVNNKFQEARRLINNAMDAVGINPKVAEQLSGADFDGDTVLCIPIEKGIKIDSKPYLKELKGFDNKEEYRGYEGMKVMNERTKQTEMGKVSNLINDMTMIGGYTENEIARAVKHSMVVIDAVKHKLDYKRSFRENRIDELYKKFQGGKDGGAYTLISRSKGQKRVPMRSVNQPYTIDPKTGKKIFRYTGETKKVWDPELRKKVDTGELKTFVSTKMYETEDARDLYSRRDKPFIKEKLYGDFANTMKKMGNQARLESTKVKGTSYNPTAAKVYAKEVESLNAKLKIAEYNKPYERLAQVVGGKMLKDAISAKFSRNEEVTYEEKKKMRGKFLTLAREQVGAHKERIKPTDEEWAAMQAGAFRKTKLEKIINNCDSDRLKELALPKTEVKVKAAQLNRIQSLYNSGLTIAEIAKEVGVSVSTVTKYTAPNADRKN